MPAPDLTDPGIRRYDPAVCVVFHRTREAFGGLSNMAAGFPVVVSGVQARTAEALYQCCRFPHHPEIQQRVLDERSPIAAKQVARAHDEKSRPDWMHIRTRVMRWVLRAKLLGSWTRFGDLLLSTGTRPIVERSSGDTFWGAVVAPDGTLEGRNVLGRLLMELRELRRANEATLSQLHPPPIPKFLLLGHVIGDVHRLEDEQRRLP